MAEFENSKWPDLPRECIEQIASSCEDSTDIMRLQATCMDWRRELSGEIFWRRLVKRDFGRTLRHHNYRTSYSEMAQCRHNLQNGTYRQYDVWHDAHERWVTAIGLSPGGGRVISGSMDCIAKVWDRSTGNWIQYLRGHSSAICSVSFPTDDRAVTGSRDGTARIWDVERGNCVCTFSMEGGRQWINAVDAWSLGKQQPSLAFQSGHGGNVFEMTIHGSSSSIQMACGSSIGRLEVFDSRSPQAPTVRLHDVSENRTMGSVYGVSVYQGMTLAAGTSSGKIYLFDLRKPEALLNSFMGHDTAITCLVLRNDLLVSADLEGLVCMWRHGLHQQRDQASSGSDDGLSKQPVILGSYRHKDWVRCVAEEDGMIVSCCKSGEIRCASFGVPEPLEGKESSPLNKSFLKVQSTWHIEKPVGLWEVKDKCGLSALPRLVDSDQHQQAYGVALDQSGIVVGCHDRSIRQYWFSRQGCVLAYSEL